MKTCSPVGESVFEYRVRYVRGHSSADTVRRAAPRDGRWGTAGTDSMAGSMPLGVGIKGGNM